MTLIPRIEQATAEQVRDLLEEAGKVIFQPPATCWADARETGVESAYGVWQANISRFLRLLDAEAWTSAAELLVPEGWSWTIGEMRGIGKFRGWLNDHNTPDGLAVRHVDADAATPALALAAASLRASLPTTPE